MIISEFLSETEQKLKQAGIETARLDAQVLLTDVLGKDKSWLLAHGDEPLPASLLRSLRAKVTKRATRYPLAYIRGKQEFYGRDFVVNKRVLIPRPESEALIDLLKPLVAKKSGHLIDVGTGSGALGITAALECPNLEVVLTDIDKDALAIANHNGRRFKLRLQYYPENLLDNYADAPDYPYIDYILTNLPYVERSWQRSPETDYEPTLALFAEDGGLALIKKLLKQAPVALRSGGYVLLEADPRQHAAIQKFAEKQNLVHIRTQGFAMVFQKPRLSHLDAARGTSEARNKAYT